MTDTERIMSLMCLPHEELEKVVKTLTELVELKHQMEGLASPRQIRFLEKKGFVHVERWKFETARDMIDRIAANRWQVPRDVVPQEYDPERTEAV